MSVPGVSGGTMAILLGIYDKLISSISNFFKDIKGNFLFLAKVAIGGVLGIGSLAFLIKWLLEVFPIPVSFFFLGAVIGGIPALYKKTREQPITAASFIYFILGLIIVLSIGFIPAGNIDFGTGSIVTQILMFLVTGIIIAIALVLPGISTSHMLIVLGMYDEMLAAITGFNIIYLGVIGIAVLLGVIITTKPIEWTMNKYPHQTYCMIIGFVLGSTSEIFSDKIIPAIPASPDFGWILPMAVLSVATFVLGILGITFLSKYSND